MKLRISTITAIFLLILTGCSQTNDGEGTSAPAPSGTLPNPQITTISTPQADATAKAYLDAWGEGDYLAMYNMLTTLSQDALPFEEFEGEYAGISRGVTLTGVSYEILQTLVSPSSAEVGYRVTLESGLVEPFSADTSMNLSLQSEEWKVVWDRALILPQLTDGNQLSMEVFTPSRGNIYDNDGDIIAADVDTIYSLTVIPSLIDEDSEGGLVAQLAALTGLPSGHLRSLIFVENPDFFIPIGEVSGDQFARREDFISPYFSMMRVQTYDGRLYFDGAAGSHVTGWVGPIPGDEEAIWVERGYPVDALVGRSGIESWGEEFLAGKRGGDLYLVNEDRTEIITRLSSGETEPSNSIYLTLDKDLQLQAQLAIKDFVGAVVVLERDTGRVLAMASSPGFNPNAANPFNFHNEVQWGGFFADPNTPFINRSTQGQYPPGSIFKIITLAAALESELYTPQAELFCGHHWNGLSGIELDDWTFEKELPASGQLTLLQGLMRSCNPWFYEIGLSLYSNDFKTAVADMARAFGLGSETGLLGLPEESGGIDNPDDSAGSGTPGAAAAVQQAIGQHTTTITALQGAAYAAAVGNDGTLYVPYVMDRIEDTNGDLVRTFEPEENGTLPISAATLQAIRTGMRLVVNDPRGTAFRQFSGFQIQTWGKTGTASAAFGDPHAWFIGYTNAGRPNQPDIAIAVLVESIGDGSEFAAPIWRRVAEGYFFGQPQRIYPWESQIYVFDPSYFEESTDEEGAEENSDTIQLTPSQ